MQVDGDNSYSTLRAMKHAPMTPFGILNFHRLVFFAMLNLVQVYSTITNYNS